MRVRKIRVATILFVLWSVAVTCVADSWRLPEAETVYSRNRQFAASIIPKQLAGQLEYFQDKVEGRADAGAAKGVANNWPRDLFYSVAPNQQLNFLAEFKTPGKMPGVSRRKARSVRGKEGEPEGTQT